MVNIRSTFLKGPPSISLGLGHSLLMVLTLSSTMSIFVITDIIEFFQKAIRTYGGGGKKSLTLLFRIVASLKVIKSIIFMILLHFPTVSVHCIIYIPATVREFLIFRTLYTHSSRQAPMYSSSKISSGLSFTPLSPGPQLI